VRGHGAHNTPHNRAHPDSHKTILWHYCVALLFDMLSNPLATKCHARSLIRITCSDGCNCLTLLCGAHPHIDGLWHQVTHQGRLKGQEMTHTAQGGSPEVGVAIRGHRHLHQQNNDKMEQAAVMKGMPCCPGWRPSAADVAWCVKPAPVLPHVVRNPRLLGQPVCA
jgi:hypothetical protein